MNYSKLVIVGILMLILSGEVLAQQASVKPNTSSKYRKIFTLAGGGGGFAIGMFAGLSAYDDAIDSEKKVTTAAIVGGTGGAVGGYLLGRVLDKRRDRSNQSRQRTVQLLPLIFRDVRGAHISLSF